MAVTARLQHARTTQTHARGELTRAATFEYIQTTTPPAETRSRHTGIIDPYEGSAQPAHSTILANAHLVNHTGRGVRRRSAALICVRAGEIHAMSICRRVGGGATREGSERGSEGGLLLGERLERTSFRAPKNGSAAGAADVERWAAGGCGIARYARRDGVPTATPRVRPSHGARRRRRDDEKRALSELNSCLKTQSPHSGRQTDAKKLRGAPELRVLASPHRARWCCRAAPPAGTTPTIESLRTEGVKPVTHCATLLHYV